MTKYGHTWRLRLRLNAPCNFSTSPFTKTLRLFFSDPGFRSWPLAKGLTLPLLARQYRFKKAGDCLPPSFSSHPWLLTFWDYNPFATHKFGSSARWKTWARYLPSSINSRLMSFQPKPSNRKKKKGEKKEPFCLPSHSLLQSRRLDLLPWKRVVCPPLFSRFAPHLPALLSQAFSLSLSLCLVYCHGGPRSMNEYSRVEGCWWDKNHVASIAALHCHAETLRRAHTGQQEYISHTQRCLSFVRDECAKPSGP